MEPDERKSEITLEAPRRLAARSMVPRARGSAGADRSDTSILAAWLIFHPGAIMPRNNPATPEGMHGKSRFQRPPGNQLPNNWAR